MGVKKVIHGRRHAGTRSNDSKEAGIDRYRIPKEMGIFHELDMSEELNLNALEVMRRIQRHQERFQSKIQRKKKAEA
eukprot:10341804-Prorocentrum_lima.AAC.1